MIVAYISNFRMN